MTAGGTRPELAARVRRLRRLRRVPDDVLTGLVTEQGMVRRPLDDQALTAAARALDPDRELAARLCAGCPVQDECLELDLRWMADRTVGVFAGLPESDRRALHELWAADRSGAPGRPTDPAAADLGQPDT
jgi:WhiB family transcriptional regulator, redox-sensing transcriptional regulator